MRFRGATRRQFSLATPTLHGEADGVRGKRLYWYNLLGVGPNGRAMPTRCAHCGDIAGRGRSLPVPAEWLAYLTDERGLSAPVGRLTMPLCPTCYRELSALEDGDDETAVEDALDEVDLTQLVDEGA